MRRCRRSLAILFVLALTAGPVELARVHAQTDAAPPDLARAQDVRNEFRRLLDRYPPELARVLKLDPALMSNEAYMAPYPAVAAFVEEHPEIARYSGYFLDFISFSAVQSPPLAPEMQLRREAINLWGDVAEGFAIVSGITVVAGAFLLLVRSIVQHRRWLRAARLQSEAHGKLLERFGSSQDVLAYVQSPAGNHFLTATPPLVGEQAPAALSATPFPRILWAVQAGVVLVSGGVGLLIIRRYVAVEVGEMLLTLGVLAASLGIGFMLAALASFSLSRRLGLIDENAMRRTSDNDARGV